MINKHPKLLGYKDAYNFLGISKTTLDDLIKKYQIYYQKISSGKVFFESDLIEFINSSERKENLKHSKKNIKP